MNLAFGQIFAKVNFEFTPINVDFTGIISIKDLTIVYGNYGSILIKQNNTEKPRQIKIFESGKIINMFFNDNFITAFNENGFISNSTDNGNTWYVEKKLQIDTLLNVIKYPNHYFLRTKNKLITLSEEFEIINEFNLYSNEGYYNYGYKSSINYFKNFLIVQTDSSKLIIFNDNLSPLDTISFFDFGFCQYCLSTYQIYSDSTYFYAKVEGKIYRTSDLKNFEFLSDNYGTFYKPLNHSIYFLSISHTSDKSASVICNLYKYNELDSVVKILDYRYKGVTSDITINDFVIADSILFIAGDSKFFASINLSDTSANIYSCISRAQNHDPYKINDSSFVFFKGYHSGFYDTYIYQSNDNGILFKPTINPYNEPKITSFRTFLFTYLDTNNNILFIGAQEKFYFRPNGILIFKDYGSNFSFKLDSNLQFDEYYYHGVAMPRLIKRNNHFIIQTYNLFSGTGYNRILTLSEEFEVVSELRDSNFAIVYVVESLDTNTFLINCYNQLDSTTDFRYTFNKGKSWEVIKKYSISDSTLYYKEFKMNNKRYFAFFYFNKIDSNFSVDILDVENLSVSLLHSFKVQRFEQRPVIFDWIPIVHYGILAENDTLFLAINDTLFFTSDIYIKDNWKYFLLPNHGFIDRSFKKFNDKFYAYYADDFNKPNSFWIKIKEDISKPKPTITTDDIYFAVRDISIQYSLVKLSRIYNTSPDADLIISGYSKLTNSAFSTNLPEINENNPIIIKPQNYFEFEAYFKPKEVKEYSDSIIFYSDALESDSICYLFGRGIDTSTSVIDYHNYLYCYPPYPVPATNTVRSLIYWDTSLDIENDDIAVYDIFGNKVAGKEKITIEKQNAYSGILSWNCTNVPDGIYLIRLIHGSETRTMKVIVSK
jgi:hypothetical protein